MSAEIVGTDGEDDGARPEVEHVLLETKEQAATDIAADATIGDLQMREIGG